MRNELFKNIPSKVGDLVKDVRNGRIGLPDLQRPFVWRDNKVRELFDSMLKGYAKKWGIPIEVSFFGSGGMIIAGFAIRATLFHCPFCGAHIYLRNPVLWSSTL